MRKQILYPVLALVLGGLGAALRMWQRAAAYDERGLPVSGAPLSIVLILFLIACAGLFLLFAFRMPKTLEEQSAAVQGNLHAVLLTASGALILLCGVLYLAATVSAYLDVSGTLYNTKLERSMAMRAFLLSNFLNLMLVLASLPTAVALVYRAKLTRSGGALNSFSALMPPFFCWIWLIEVYRQHTANPILWDYVLLLFAAISLLVSGYYRAGFAFEAGKPRRAVFTSLLALFFAAAALPDFGDPAAGFALAALVLCTLTEILGLLARLAPPYRPRRLAEEDTPAVPRSDSNLEEDSPNE